MTSVLRIAVDIGFDELYALKAQRQSVALVGNTEQVVPQVGLESRQVVSSRLENLSRACLKVHRFDEVSVSDNPSIANAVFGDKAARTSTKCWIVRSLDASRISDQIAKLNLDLIDRVRATSQTALEVLKRRLPSNVRIDFHPLVPRIAAYNWHDATISQLSWVGSPDPDEGLQDALRVASQTDLPFKIYWTRTPSPTEFTATVAAVSMLGLEERLEFGIPGTFEAFTKLCSNSTDAGNLWISTTRDYPKRSAWELIAALGAPIVAFDSMYARSLASTYGDAIRLGSEGDVMNLGRMVASFERTRSL